MAVVLILEWSALPYVILWYYEYAYIAVTLAFKATIKMYIWEFNNLKGLEWQIVK